MKDEQKRFGKGFAVALAVHLILAAGLGIFGYRFVHTPPEILEVSLEGGGGGAEAQEEEIEQEEQQEEPIIQSLEDIIDQKLKPKPQKKIVKKKATAAPGPKAPAGNPAGNGTGTGTGSGTGSGNGSGNGNGSGSGSGSEGRGVPVKPPRLLREVAPVYPASARNSGATGVVTVRILVGADGSVEDVTVVGSSGNGAMDNSVVTAVNKWSFSPAKDKYGQNARCRVTRAVSFNLR